MPKEEEQSSQAKEESQTIVKKAAKTRRTSARQEQKCIDEGDELATKKPPVKKPRQNRLSPQAKEEEKKRAEKEHADTLAYISKAICSAGPEGCYHEGQENVFTSGPNKNGSNCGTCRRMFRDVCLHVFQGKFYCTNCYKNNVVLRCATDSLFDNVFKVEFLSTQSPKKGLSARKNRNDLLKFVDNLLLS
jgi:hypothetical protein